MKTNSDLPRLKPRHLHGIRVAMIGVVLTSAALLHLDSTLSALRPIREQTGTVLAYATSIGITDLLNETNSSRASNGLGSLAISNLLNSSAQAKAQHMIDNDYWAHVAPDGTQPWHFFDSVGYEYQTAGENLAYGFSTSAGVENAWMNSPSHKANVLGTYQDVGFGIANGANYQGGQYTVVVAHYGLPLAPAAPAPTAPSSTPAPAASTPAATASPTPTTPEEPTPIAQAPVAETPVQSNSETATPIANDAAKPQPVAQTDAKNISALEGFGMGIVPPVIAISLTLTSLAGIAFAMTHRALMKHALFAGEQFVIAHPVLDISLIAAVVAVILSTTVAKI